MTEMVALGEEAVPMAALPNRPIAEPLADLPEGFDAAKYLRTYPDVAAAVQGGDYKSAQDHFQRHGHQERRLEKLEYRHAWPVEDSASFPRFGVDVVFWTEAGNVFVIGWIDDYASPLASLGLMLHETLLGATDVRPRCRREDAERTVGAGPGRLLGFWSVFRARTDVPPEDVRLVLMTGTEQQAITVGVQRVTDEHLRAMALEYLATASYWGHMQVEAFDHLDGGMGEALIRLNNSICRQFAGGAFCRRFGARATRPAASVVVCLYGKVEYMFLQAALFTAGDDLRDVEFIYVSNSPELAERLMKEAALATRIYGLAITLVILPGNVGFGMANNIAVQYAQSDRIILLNPDVFPRERNWARVHAALVETLPAEQTRLFGVPLFYDDGSLMHGGMYFELDEGFSVRADGVRRRELARVEHYGKGAPPDTERFLRARPVPAVSGAFMSVSRDWFETLGGFSSDYVFGHYEDADLCLRSLAAGTEVWMHPVPFWHMEGKGSSRRPMHEGGSLVNRWYFTRTWAGVLRDGLLGPAPARLVAA
jgi:GT2 family glycosyltransferase